MNHIKFYLYKFPIAVIILILIFSCSRDSSSHHFKNGSAKYQLKDYSGAINDLNKAIEIKPEFIDAYYTRAICESKVKKYDKALSDFNKVIELDPNHKDALFNRAFYVKEKTGDFEGAITDYNRFIELNENGNIAFALNNRGYSKFKLNDVSGAIADINKSLELYPNNAYAYRYRAEIFITLDSLNVACSNLQEALNHGYSEYDNIVEELIKKYCNL